MPIIYNKEISNGHSVAVWNVTEPVELLGAKVHLSDKEQETYQRLKTDQRKGEWLATRALLREMLDASALILYEASGKPYLKGSPTGLSISHSGNYVAMATHSSANPGIDIEHIHQRLLKIAPRFLNESERNFIQPNSELEQLCMIWCCKEALYKVHTGGNLIFKENIIIEPFEPGERGRLTGAIRKGGKQMVHRLAYERINNYMLVYTEDW